MINAPTLAARKMAFIEAQLAAGRTITLATALRATPISPATWRRWEATGRVPVKLSANGQTLLVWERGRYVDANGCQLTAH